MMLHLAVYRRLARRSAPVRATVLLLLLGMIASCDRSGPSEPPAGQVMSVTLSPTADSIARGETRQLTAIVRNAAGAAVPDAVVEWSSANESIARVSGTGLVTGVAVGSTSIRARVGTVSGEARVDVRLPHVARVEISPGYAALATGAPHAFRAMGYSAAGDSIPEVSLAWSASGGGISVSGNGSVAASQEGAGWVVARAGGVADSARVVGLTSTSILALAAPESGYRQQAAPGEEVRVRVTLDLSRVSPTGALGALVLDVEFDPQVLEPLGSEVTAGEGAGIARLTQPDRVRLAFAAGRAQGRPVPALLTLRFRVAPGATAGTESHFRVRISDPFTDLSGTPFRAPVTVGGVVRVVVR